MVNSVYLSTPINTIDASITFLLFLWSYGVFFVSVVVSLFADFSIADNRPSLRIEGEDSGSGEWLFSFSLFFLSFLLFLLSLYLFFHGGGYSSILSVSLSLAPAPEFSSLICSLMLLLVTLSFIPPLSLFFLFPPVNYSSNASAFGAFAVIFASSFDSVAAAAFIFFSSCIFNFSSSNIRCDAIYSSSSYFIFASSFDYAAAAAFIFLSSFLFNLSSSNMHCDAMSSSSISFWRRFCSYDTYAVVPAVFWLFADDGIVLQE